MEGSGGRSQTAGIKILRVKGKNVQFVLLWKREYLLSLPLVEDRVSLLWSIPWQLDNSQECSLAKSNKKRELYIVVLK